jgi:RNA 2',3'-cyclic 3'-phosphodiesterase
VVGEVLDIDREDRLFIGAAIDVEARHALAHALSVSGVRVPGKPVPPESWHVTLRFLGTTSALTRDRFMHELDETITVAPFRLRLRSLGSFPRSDKATVLWIGADGGDALPILGAQCEAAAEAVGYEPEGRPFVPHLTLSRIRPPEDVRKLVGIEVPAVRTTIDRITLFRSTLGGRVPEYEVIDEIKLA